MTMLSILNQTAKMLNRSSLVTEIETLQAVEPEARTSAEISTDLKLLLQLANTVIHEAVEEYVPQVFLEELITNSSCEIQFSSLSKTILKPIWVKNSMGQKETFNTYATFLKTGLKAQSVEVCYQFTPPDYSIFDNVELSGFLTERVFAIGTCAEFCLINLLFDEASMWDAKYKTALQNVMQIAKERRFNKRRLV